MLGIFKIIGSKKLRDLTGMVMDRRLNEIVDEMERTFEVAVEYLTDCVPVSGDFRASLYQDDQIVIDFSAYRVMYREHTGGLAYKLASDNARQRHDRVFSNLKFILYPDQNYGGVDLHSSREKKLVKNNQKYEKLQ